ncbi:PTS beta-glucoside transporter subunit IIABC [Alphaproteobacteria bacterium]|nr:PTS beta-glucoside transporter subunit IIABC [Alphaproteobacteria bacterium]
MNTENQITKTDDENPFKDMGFIKFWVISTVFWFFFPVSLALCYLAVGSVKTKQLVKALVHDFLQTLFIILAVISVIIYTVCHYISGMF